MRKTCLIGAAMGLWLMLPLSSMAQDAGCVFLTKEIDDVEIGNVHLVSDGNIDAHLQACTRIIDAGQAGKTELAAARANRANIYLIKGDPAAADKDASAAIALDPDHSPAHIARAQVLFWKGLWDKALLETNAAIKLDSANDWIYNHRGIIDHYFAEAGASGDLVIGDIVVADPVRWVQRAISDFDYAAKLNPAEVGYHINSCRARAIWGKELENALAECEKAATMEPAMPPVSDLVLESLCLVKFRMGKYAAAIEDCSAALKNNHKRPASLYVRGLALNQTGQSGAGDIAAAKEINRKIDAVYGIFGVTP